MFLFKAFLLILFTSVIVTKEVGGQHPAAQASRSFLNPNPDAAVVFQYSPGPFKFPRQLNIHRKFVEHLLPVAAPSVLVKLAGLIDSALGRVFALVKKAVSSAIGAVVSMVRAFLPMKLYEALMPRGLARFAPPKRPEPEFHRIF